VTRDGTHAQYLIVELDSLSEKPPILSMEEASAVGVPYLAAWSALVHAADIQAGETVLITGALGAVGRAATQIAHWKKAKVIGSDISNKASEADAFVNAKEKDLSVEVTALTNGKGADLVLDAVGGPMFEPSLQSLRVGGRQVAIASIGDGRVEFNLVDFYHNLQRLIGVDTLKLTGPEIAKIWMTCGRALRTAICDRRPFSHGCWIRASMRMRRLRRVQHQVSTSFYLGDLRRRLPLSIPVLMALTQSRSRFSAGDRLMLVTVVP
jgi:NADPH:quinone reductase-like Zn-dependent oxidoreductase